MSQWLVEIAELRLSPSDFEFKHCLEWVEYRHHATLLRVGATWNTCLCVILRFSR